MLEDPRTVALVERIIVIGLPIIYMFMARKRRIGGKAKGVGPRSHESLPGVEGKGLTGNAESDTAER